MPHPLELKLARLRRRARQLVALKAGARTMAYVLGTAVLLSLLDALFHFQDRGVRAIFSLLLLTAAAVGVRSVVQALRSSRYRDVQMAHRVEQVFPRLRGHLASAIEFVHESESDPLAGSPELRRAVIRGATAELERCNISATLDARPARRAASIAGLTLAATLTLVALDAASARIAALRLLNPLSDVQWPRLNQLTIVEPVERLPQGQSFEVRVTDLAGEPLPDDVAMHYRYRGPDGAVTEESEPLQWIGGALLARRDGVQRPFEYRAVGGDDHTMTWRQLEIVEPPVIRSSRINLRFPEYTGWPSRGGDLNLRVLAGTKVDIQAIASKPLNSAEVRFSSEVAIPMALGTDGQTLTVPNDAEHEFVVTSSGSYHFDLVDREGFRSPEAPKYEVRAMPDGSPVVDIAHPKANIFVTAHASVPLLIRAQDDLAIRRVSLDYLRSDKSDEGEQTFDLLVGPARIDEELAAASAAATYGGDRRELSQEWSLKPLGLPPGTQITFHASAVDYAEQVGQSLPRRLTIVTPEEAQDRLAERQGVIFNELARVLQLQQTARSHVTGLEVQLNQTGKLAKSDVDILQGASLNQQQVERELTSETDGLLGQVTDFLDELRINKIDGPDTHRQMQSVVAELARLAQGPLPVAARELTAATKAAQVELQDAPTAESAGVSAPLKGAGTAQDDVVDALSRLMDDMKQWVNYRHFHREIAQVGKAQEEIAQQTAELGQKTLSRAFQDLEPQQRADLEKLAQRQLDLARRLNRLEQRLEDTAATARQEDPLAAESMSDALAHARNRGIAEAMRQAGQNVAQNRTGQATQGQTKAGEDLQELLDILSNRREHELGRLVKKLREAEQNLAQLAARQQGLQKKLAAARQTAEEERRRLLERLSRQEKQLEEETERAARTLERLQAEKASASLAKAGAKMGQAAANSGAGNGAAAAEQAEAAQRDLEEARQQLAQQRRQSEIDLAEEQLARMEDAVASMHERQQKIMGETVHYQQRQAERGQLTRAEAASVRGLAQQQLAIRDESQELAKTLAGAEIFQFVLEVAGREMGRAGDRLDRRDLGNETLQAEANALARIEQLREAMLESAGEEPAEEPQKEGGGGEGGGEQPETKSHSVAELKLLKSIQEQINSRTLSLAEAARQPAGLSEEQQREIMTLSQEQGRLADLVANMTQVTDERPEDKPDQLPDVREVPSSILGPGERNEERP